ncbi:MAG: DUF1599 domain-containing protein [Phaeodactylibacter sp.]|nr:DUF1599 domain-containing protein [Phaeodactylibacter sp.]
MERTFEQFDAILRKCRDLFEKKTRDYGTAWRILRPSSLTDQLFIKAKRIRSIEEKGRQKVSDSIESDYIGLINYSLMAIAQLDLSEDAPLELPLEDALRIFDEKVAAVRALLEVKNHDYGEAWRDMRVSSMTDLILMKLLRIKQIEENKGKTIASEGLEANYQDIVNYAIFALIKLQEQKQNV